MAATQNTPRVEVPIVAVLGAVLQDHTIFLRRMPIEGETVIVENYSAQIGGKGANSSVAIHRLSRLRSAVQLNGVNADETNPASGAPQIRLISAVGDDQLGRSLKKELKSEGVNVDGVKELKGQETAHTTILVEAHTGANSVLLYQGACGAVTAEDFKTPESLGGGMVPDYLVAQLELARDAVEQALETAYEANIEILLNPAPARFMELDIYRMVKHLVMNETEAKTLSKDETLDIAKSDIKWENTTQFFHNLGVENVVITLGEKGAFYSRRSFDSTIVEANMVEAEKDCKVVDTSGAGDTFVGAYMASYLEQKRRNEWDIGKAVRFGCKASARIIESVGTLQPIPWRDQIREGSDNVEEITEA